MQVGCCVHCVLVRLNSGEAFDVQRAMSRDAHEHSFIAKKTPVDPDAGIRHGTSPRLGLQGSHLA